MKKPVAATFCPETRLLSMTLSAQSSLSPQDNQNWEHGERTMTKNHRSYAESGLRANQMSMVQEVHGSNISQIGCFWGESGLRDLTHFQQPSGLWSNGGRDAQLH